MIPIYMSEYNVTYSIFSILIALSASIICFDIALNLIPKLPRRFGTLWTFIAAFTFSLGTKTAFIIGIAGLLESSTLRFQLLGVVISFFIMFVTDSLGLMLLLKKKTSYVEAAVLFTLGNSVTYFTLIMSNNIFTMSIFNGWFLLSVLICFILSMMSSYMFKKELQKDHHTKRGYTGVLFGISIIGLQHLSMRGLLQVLPSDNEINIGDIVAPFLLLSVFLFMFIAFIGNMYQQKLNTEQRKLKKQERSFRSLYELNPLAIIIMDVAGVIVDINRAAEGLAGMKKEDILGKHFIKFVPEEEHVFAKQQFAKALAGGVVEYEIHMYNTSSTVSDLFVRNIPITVDDSIHGIYGMIKDITDQKRNMEKVQFMAYHAPLTNLPNKRKLTEDVAKKITNHTPFSLVYLDLNEFKKTNDRYGHLAGDAVLVEVANRLKTIEEDVVAYHIGGDEFTVTLPYVTYEEIEKIADRIAETIRMPIMYDEFILEVFASIGVARFPFDGRTIEELLQKADLAMYASKEHGQSKLVFYHDTLLKNVEERFLLEQDLKEALEKHEFEVYYQPQLELQTGKLKGAEALLRWNHPVRGMMSPYVFIHVLEETGLIVDVGEWVISQVFESICSWIKKGYDFQQISLNISAIHFEKESLYHFIKETAKGDDALLHHLDIEITESALLDLAKSVKSVRQLKKLGIIISLDDFGTGYSSLSVLHQLPIDCLKIDRSFIENLDEESKVLIRMIIQMSNHLNVKVVAEGIETKEQLDFLIQEGCTYGQGYYFGKPLPKDEFERTWLKK